MSEARRFMAFVAIGGFASAVNLVARILVDMFTSYEAAIVLAFPIALTTAFLLNRLLVFQAKEYDWRRQYRRFLIVNLAALLQVFAVSVAFARLIFPWIGFTWHAHTIAHALGLIMPLFTSYWAHKRYSFAPAAPVVPRAR